MHVHVRPVYMRASFVTFLLFCVVSICRFYAVGSGPSGCFHCWNAAGTRMGFFVLFPGHWLRLSQMCSCEWSNMILSLGSRCVRAETRGMSDVSLRHHVREISLSHVSTVRHAGFVHIACSDPISSHARVYVSFETNVIHHWIPFVLVQPR